MNLTKKYLLYLIRCYRIVEWGKYNRSEDKHPEYRCQECSIKKMSNIVH